MKLVMAFLRFRFDSCRDQASKAVSACQEDKVTEISLLKRLNESDWIKVQLSEMFGLYLETVARFGRLVAAEFSIRDPVEIFPELPHRPSDPVFV